MYQVPKVTDNIYYVGVNDRSKTKFESMWPIPHGVAYNSYLIADEKVALIDCVDVCYADMFFHKIQLVLGDRPIDYLIIDHMEPDHSGAISLLRQRYPDIKLVGNRKTLSMLEGYHGITENTLEVKTGESICLGHHELSFIMAPMVHWPEVMFCYEQTEKVLFSADAFGSFGANDGEVIYKEDMIDPAYLDEMIRYYSCIVGKYGPFVQKALKSVLDAQIEMKYICSTHGKVWGERHLPQLLSLYNDISTYRGHEGAVVIYGSMYGHTEQMADVVAAGLHDGGIKEVKCYNISYADPSEILRDIFKYRGVVIGGPTYSNSLFTPLTNLLEMIRLREVKGRLFGCFGSFSWAGKAAGILSAFGEDMGWEAVGNPVQLKQGDLTGVADDAYHLGLDMAEQLKAGK